MESDWVCLVTGHVLWHEESAPHCMWSFSNEVITLLSM